jgi:peptidoglycan/LPS O-acetylase OafA/YrhL
VVVFHFFPEHLPGGFVGVDVFFVISGFLISRIIWGELERGAFSVRKFYSRRIRRIFPALACVLASSWGIGAIFLYWDVLARLGKHIAGGAFFVSNLMLWSEGGYFDVAAERKPLLHLWSLSIEEQFYLAWPLLLALMAQWRVSFVFVGSILGVLSFALNVSLSDSDPIAAFYNPFSRFWELLLGAAVGYASMKRGSASALASQIISPIGLLLIVASSLFFDRTMAFPGWWAVAPTLGTAMLLWSDSKVSLNQRLLGCSPFVGIGLISYPLYLWHWPLLSLAGLIDPSELTVAWRLALVLLSVALAVLTYSYIEKPVRSRTGNTRPVTLLLGAVFSLGILGLITFSSNGFVRFSTVAKFTPALTEVPKLEEWWKEVREGRCFLQGRDSLIHDELCIEPKHPLILLWGDSHAAALYPGFVAAQKKSSFAIGQLTQALCPPLPKVSSVMKPNCAEINQKILGRLEKLKPEVIVLQAVWVDHTYSSSNREILDKLKTQVGLIRSSSPSTTIVVVGPMPRWNPSLPELVARYVDQHRAPAPLYLPRTESTEDERIRAFDREMEDLSHQNGVIYVSAWNILCNDNGCLSRLNDDVQGLMAFDEGHLSPTGSSFFVSRLLSELNKSGLDISR